MNRWGSFNRVKTATDDFLVEAMELPLVCFGERGPNNRGEIQNRENTGIQEAPCNMTRNTPEAEKATTDAIKCT